MKNTDDMKQITPLRVGIAGIALFVGAFFWAVLSGAVDQAFYPDPREMYVDKAGPWESQLVFLAGIILAIGALVWSESRRLRHRICGASHRSKAR